MSVYNNIEHGQETVGTAGTSVQLNSGNTITTASGGELTIRANTGNAGDVFVGDSDVSSTNGFELGAGETVTLSVADVSDIYVDAANNGDGISWIVETQ